MLHLHNTNTITILLPCFTSMCLGVLSACMFNAFAIKQESRPSPGSKHATVRRRSFFPCGPCGVKVSSSQIVFRNPKKSTKIKAKRPRRGSRPLLTSILPIKTSLDLSLFQTCKNCLVIFNRPKKVKAKRGPAL